MISVRKILVSVSQVFENTLLVLARTVVSATSRLPVIRRLVFNLSRDTFLVANAQETYLVAGKDGTISRKVYVEGEFEFHKIERAISLAKVDSSKLVFVDVGANIGVACIPVLKRGLAKRAIAFEPEPFNAKLLRINVLLNDMEDSVDFYGVALGEEEGSVEFELSDTNYGDHRIKTNLVGASEKYNESQRDIISVPVRTLDEYLPEAMLANCLIWMDTQGFEGFVLRGAQRVITAAPPLVVEFWPYGMRRSGSYPALKECLLDSAYCIFFDLRHPQIRQELSAGALDRLYANLGEEGRHTDLLLLKESA